MLRRIAFLLVLGAIAAGCEGVPTDSGVILDDGFAASRGGKWVHHVSGGGEDMYPGCSDATFSISFDARVDAADNATGKVEWWFLDGTPASYGTVGCVEFRDNRAYLSYQVEGGELEGYGEPGNWVFVGFEDNGEGAGGPADRQSFIYFAGESIPCEFFADFIEGSDGFPVEWLHGNVQVR